ncbi:hypothetical protein PATA110615_17840 [Paenibacillus taichungensis]
MGTWNLCFVTVTGPRINNHRSIIGNKTEEDSNVTQKHFEGPTNEKGTH